MKTAQLQEQLRSILAQLRHLRSQAALFTSFFENTALENRAAIEHELETVRGEIPLLESEAISIAKVTQRSSQVSSLQDQIRKIETEIEKLKAAVKAEESSLANLQELIGQLETQSAKYTRSIVSAKYLSDIDFVVCPRCGSEVSQSRSKDNTVCYLCQQHPALDFSRDILIKEQDAVEAQLVETQELLHERTSRIENLRKKRMALEEEIIRAKEDLDFHTMAYVSEHADRIAELAAKRSALKARERQLEDYLSVFKKLDESERKRSELAIEKERLEGQLEAESREAQNAMVRMKLLETKFNEILERFQPPVFGEESVSSIDHTTYLPIYHGRRFDDLSSPGLATLVNIAHAVAHHLTSIECNLRLPNLLIIDGLSEHLGQEGLDPERLNAVYEFLIELSKNMGEDLQLIVVDNEVPESARSFVRLELAETNRLIPQEGNSLE